MSINQLRTQISSDATIGDQAIVGLITDQTVSAAGGWTVVRSGNLGTFNYMLARRTIVSGDPGTIYTWPLGGNTDNCTYFNMEVNGLTSFDTTGLNTYAGGTTSPVAPAINLAAAGELVLALWLVDGETDVTLTTAQPAGWLASDFTRGNLSILMIAFIQPTSPTPALTATLANSLPAAAIQMSARGSNINIPTMFSGGLG